MKITGIYKLRFTDRSSLKLKRDEYHINETSVWFKNLTRYDRDKLSELSFCMWVTKHKIISVKRAKGRLNIQRILRNRVIRIRTASVSGEIENNEVFRLTARGDLPSSNIEETVYRGILFTDGMNTNSSGKEATGYEYGARPVSSIYFFDPIRIKPSEALTCFYSLTVRGLDKSTMIGSPDRWGTNYMYSQLLCMPSNIVRNPNKIQQFKAYESEGGVFSASAGGYVQYDEFMTHNESDHNRKPVLTGFSDIRGFNDLNYKYGEVYNTISSGGTDIAFIENYKKSCSSAFTQVVADGRIQPSRLINVINYGYSTGRVSVNYSPPYIEPAPINLDINIVKDGEIGKGEYSLSRRYISGKPGGFIPLPSMMYEDIQGLENKDKFITHQNNSTLVPIRGGLLLWVSRWHGISIVEIGGYEPRMLDKSTFPELDYDSVGNLVYLDNTDAAYLSSGTKGVYKISGFWEYIRNNTPLLIEKINYPGKDIYAFDIDRKKRITIATDTGIHRSMNEGGSYSSSPYKNSIKDGLSEGVDQAILNATLIQTSWDSGEVITHVHFEGGTTKDIVLKEDFSVKERNPLGAYYFGDNSSSTSFSNPHLTHEKGSIPFGRYMELSGFCIYAMNIRDTPSWVHLGEGGIGENTLKKISDTMVISITNTNVSSRWSSVQSASLYKVSRNIEKYSQTRLPDGRYENKLVIVDKNIEKVRSFSTTNRAYDSSDKISKDNYVTPDFNLIFRDKSGIWYMSDTLLPYFAWIEEKYPNEIYQEIFDSNLRFNPNTKTWVYGEGNKTAPISSTPHKFLGATIVFDATDKEKYKSGDRFIGILSDGMIRDGTTAGAIFDSCKFSDISEAMTQSGTIERSNADGFYYAYELNPHLYTNRYMLSYKGKPTICTDVTYEGETYYESISVTEPYQSFNDEYEWLSTVESLINDPINSIPGNDIRVIGTVPYRRLKGNRPAIPLGDRSAKTGAYASNFNGICTLIPDRDSCLIDGKKIKYIHYDSLDGNRNYISLDNIESGTVVIDTIAGVLFFSPQDIGKTYQINYYYKIDNVYKLGEYDSKHTLEEIVNA